MEQSASGAQVGVPRACPSGPPGAEPWPRRGGERVRSTQRSQARPARAEPPEQRPDRPPTRPRALLVEGTRPFATGPAPPARPASAARTATLRPRRAAALSRSHLQPSRPPLTRAVPLWAARAQAPEADAPPGPVTVRHGRRARSCSSQRRHVALTSRPREDAGLFARLASLQRVPFARAPPPQRRTIQQEPRSRETTPDGQSSWQWTPWPRSCTPRARTPTWHRGAACSPS